MAIAPKRNAMRGGPRAASRRAVALAMMGSAWSAGCDSCERNQPYTPFHVDASAVPSLATTQSAAAPTASAPKSPEVPEPTEGRRLEPPTGRFSIGRRQVELPKDLLAERVLERGGGPDRPALGFAWTVPASPDPDWNGPLGELWMFPENGDARRLLPLPGWVPSGPGCVHESRLALLGKSTLLIDVHAKCERSLPQRTPTRAIALMTVEPSPVLLVGLRVAEPAADESFSLTTLAADRDGDGRDDPTIRFDFSILSSQLRAKAELGWLDRAAGASVDAGHFVQSLEETFLTWEGALGKKSSLGGILGETAALRRLLSSLCQQSSVPRITDWRGEPIACPAISKVATRLARIEIRAALGLADPVAAAFALGYGASWLGGIPTVEREELAKRIVKSTVPVNVGLPIPVTPRPVAALEPIHYSPIRFESDGRTLLVQTQRGTTERVSLDGSSSVEDSDAAPTAWPLSVTSSDGRHWAGAIPACDRSEVALVFKHADGTLLPLAPTNLLAPRPGVCRNLAPWPVVVGPIAWQSEYPTAVIGGACWSGVPSQACPPPAKMGPVLPGSPRSPDGRRLISVTTLGPMVVGGAKAELWKGAGVEGKRLSDCVVANDAEAIACIANGAVLLLRRPGAGEAKE